MVIELADSTAMRLSDDPMLCKMTRALGENLICGKVCLRYDVSVLFCRKWWATPGPPLTKRLHARPETGRADVSAGR